MASSTCLSSSDELHGKERDRVGETVLSIGEDKTF